MKASGLEHRQVAINPQRAVLGRTNAVLSVNRPSYHPAEFAGPLSIKWMAAGWGLWKTEEGQFRVTPESYLVLNHDRPYLMSIDLDEPTASFCIFFARGFVEDVCRTLTTKHEVMLDEPLNPRSGPLEFWEHTARNSELLRQLRRMSVRFRLGDAADEWLADQFHHLARRLLETRQDVQRAVSNVPAVRASTRTELFRRLERSRDYIHSHFSEALSIDTMANFACLSPHHFHRLFTRTFHRTPHDYVLQLRIERAKTLLKHTDLPIIQICLEVGFESPSSFSARFSRETGTSPARFRAERQK